MSRAGEAERLLCWPAGGRSADPRVIELRAEAAALLAEHDKCSGSGDRARLDRLGLVMIELRKVNRNGQR